MLPPDEQAPELFKTELFSTFPQGIQVQTLSFNHHEAPLPGSVSRRSLSRSGVMLVSVSLPAEKVLKPFLDQDPFSVGVYCALEPGPVDFAAARKMAGSNENFGELYRTQVNAKAYFQTMPNLPAAQICIAFGIQGRCNIFIDSANGGQRALEQAKRDLAAQRVRAALVCGAYSLESPLVVLRDSKRKGGDRILSEGAAAVVLVSAKGEPAQRESVEKPSPLPALHDYGNCRSLIELAREHVT